MHSRPIRLGTVWSRGGWWRAPALAVAYLAFYLGVSLLVGRLFESQIDDSNPLASVSTVFFGLALPILLGGVLLLLFTKSLGWFKEVFGPQPIKGSAWMWIAVVILVVPIGLRLASINWSAYSGGVIVTMLLTGLFIGLAEELLTRGLAVNLLRRAGHSEKVVMVVSSLLFALLHSVNALTQPIVNVALTVVYTFGFGAMMYLVLRVTGSILWPILLHAATDPTTVLATGGVDAHGDAAGSESLIRLAGTFNFVYVVLALVAIFFVKGKVSAGHTQPGQTVGPQ